MGVRSLTGPEFTALPSSSSARTPSESAPKPAQEDNARAVSASTELNEAQASKAPKAAPRVTLNERAGTRLEVDPATDRIVAQILDGNQEVIRQIPPEEMLKTLAKVRRLQGLLFDQQA